MDICVPKNTHKIASRCYLVLWLLGLYWIGWIGIDGLDWIGWIGWIGLDFQQLISANCYRKAGKW